MTAAQKAAKEKFSKAIAYRTKTGVSLKEAFAHVYGKKVGAIKKKTASKKKAAVKKAIPKKKTSVKKVAPVKAAPAKTTVKKYNSITTVSGIKKAAAKKKAAPKKVTSSHKDTKSHNVNIRVMSGINKMIGNLRRQYIAVFHLSDGSAENEVFSATSLKEAKVFASMYKRRNGFKGRVTVHLIKR